MAQREHMAVLKCRFITLLKGRSCLGLSVLFCGLMILICISRCYYSMRAVRLSWEICSVRGVLTAPNKALSTHGVQEFCFCISLFQKIPVGVGYLKMVYVYFVISRRLKTAALNPTFLPAYRLCNPFATYSFPYSQIYLPNFPPAFSITQYKHYTQTNRN